jgi:response regulator RpfG family c-di-GMP phosphodiesterase
MFKNILELNQQEIVEQVMLTAYLAEYAEWDNRTHLERVRRYTYILANGYGVGHEQASLISIAAILHDIGKITIPVSILKKTANLEKAEYKITERHTTEGARLLHGSSSPIFQAGAVIAQTHHERWDGSGYPEGLKGEEIPLSGRILAIVDVFDALTTWRPYKKEIGTREAHDMIKKSSGVLFDPQLITIFSNKFDDFGSIFRATIGS